MNIDDNTQAHTTPNSIIANSDAIDATDATDNVPMANTGTGTGRSSDRKLEVSGSADIIRIFRDREDNDDSGTSGCGSDGKQEKSSIIKSHC